MLLTLCSCGLNDITKKQSDKEKTITESSEKQDTEDEGNNSEEIKEDTEPKDFIDLDGLSAIENKDTSKVKITKKEVQKDAVSGFTMHGGDALNLTISNDGDADVTKFTLYMSAIMRKMV